MTDPGHARNFICGYFEGGENCVDSYAEADQFLEALRIGGYAVVEVAERVALQEAVRAAREVADARPGDERLHALQRLRGALAALPSADEEANGRET